MNKSLSCSNNGINLPVIAKFTSFFIVLVLLGAHFTRFYSFYIDDTFIHLRYAAHLLDGHGFSYNIGQPPVLGTSSPLWNILLMPSVMLNRFDPLPSVKLLSLVLGVGFLLLLNMCIVIVDKKLNSSIVPANQLLANIAVLLLLASPRHWAWFFSGMEVPLYNFLYVVIALLIGQSPLKKNKAILYSTALAASCFLLFLARPEGAVACLSAFLVLLLKSSNQTGDEEKSGLLPFMVVGCLLLAGWVIYTQITFGYTLPTSVSAKGAAMPLLSLAPGKLFASYIQVLLGVYWLPIISSICLLAMLIKLRPKILRKWAGTSMTLFNLTYITLTLIIYLLKNGHLIERYTPIFGPALIILLGQLIILVWPVLLERINLFRKNQTWIVLGISIMFASFGILAISRVSNHYDKLIERYDNLKIVAKTLNQSLSKNGKSWVLLETVGVVSYYVNASIMDIAGLVSPEFTNVSHLLGGNVDRGGTTLAAQREIISEQIMAKQPKFIVLKPTQYQTYIEGLFQADRLQLRKIFHTPQDATGWDSFIVWQVEYGNFEVEGDKHN